MSILFSIMFIESIIWFTKVLMLFVVCGNSLNIILVFIFIIDVGVIGQAFELIIFIGNERQYKF